MIYIVYTLLWFFVLPFLTIFALIHGLFNKKHRTAYFKRLTWLLPKNTNPNGIWIHAVSTGEVAACIRLIEWFVDHSDCQIVLSCYTETGFQMAQKRIVSSKVKLGYTPYDAPILVRRFLHAIKPALFLIMETEIWPGMVTECHKRSIPVCMINGRIYEKDFKAYKRFAWVLQPTLAKYTQFMVQSQTDVTRLEQIGAPKNRITYYGNLKMDVYAPQETSNRNHLRRLLMHYSEYIYLIAASTHRGEEKLLLQAFKKLVQTFPAVKLILAPRHPHRIQEVIGLIEDLGFSYQLRSKDIPGDCDVFLVDTIGELMDLFALSHLVVMGGTFSKQVGGHNILEPALYGKPIWSGPYYYNFQAITEDFIAADAISLIPDSSTTHVIEALEQYFETPDAYLLKGERGKALIQSQQGVTQTVGEECLKWMNLYEAEGYGFY